MSQPPPRPAENVTLYAVEAERQYDKLALGLFRGGIILILLMWIGATV